MKSRILICVFALLGFAALAVPMSLAAQEHHVKHRKYRLVDLGTFGGPNSIFNARPIAKI